jgi:predicted PurR-regulated permease PerM
VLSRLLDAKVHICRICPISKFSNDRQHDHGIPGSLIAFWLAWRGVQDYVNMPHVMGKGLDLHPLLAIFAILIGGEIGGVLGIFLSIPTVAAARILWMNWTRRISVRKTA